MTPREMLVTSIAITLIGGAILTACIVKAVQTPMPFGLIFCGIGAAFVIRLVSSVLFQCGREWMRRQRPS
jgi:hypothetical protein